MNNRNQNQNRQIQAPLPASPPTPATYLNVFTVEEYERDGKAQKRWTKMEQHFLIRRVAGSVSS